MRMAASKPAVLKWADILAFVLTVAVNSLAGGTTILGGKLTSEISDSNPTLVTPAGYVFSVWGVIYVLLGIFVIYQAVINQSERGFARRIGWLFVLSSVLNICWLFLWQFEYLALSVVLMFLLLATLIAIYLRLGIGKSTVSMREKLAVHVPFSVYLGWITIASIADVAVTLVYLGWDRFGISAETWAILIIAVALAITLLVVVTRRDIAYGLVVVWALLGIAAKQSSNQNIVLVSETSALVVAITLVASVFYSRLKG